MIGWYLNRLKTISFAEFPYRIGQLIQKQYEFYFCTGKFPEKQTVITKDISSRFSVTPDDLYPNLFQIFGKSFNYADQEINWHKDIFTGKCFPLIFSKKINIKSNPDSSAKNVWEVNRLQFLSFIALNYKKTGSVHYLNTFINIVNSWVEQNPYFVGINWYSNIEVNLRLITWYFCWGILDADKLMTTNPDFKKFVETTWLPSIYQHCRHSFFNPSKYSSSNNHLISEYAGLFAATSLWQFKESEDWNIYSKKGLEKEILRQHSENGINKEEAAEYIQFITDFFLIACIIGEKSDNPFSEDYENQLKKILYYIYNLLDLSGNYPQYGDEDDGKCLMLDKEEHFNNFRSLLTSAAIIFGDAVLKSKCSGIDQKNIILFGDSCIKEYEDIAVIKPDYISKFYPEEGHFILRKQEGAEEVYLHFDAAPLGYLSIAAHGHADALSFILHIDGNPIFIDPGTYTYHTEPDWRKYFIGTLAHNTIRINKLNQAVIAGPTLWLKHYHCKILKTESNDDYDIVRAQHDGYKKIGIIHIREIYFDKKSLTFKISDMIESESDKVYTLEMPFHIHPLVKVIDKCNNYFNILNPEGRDATLSTDSKLDTKIVRGQTEPYVLGWYSDSFMQKRPSDTILCSVETSGSTKFETIISINQL